MIGKAQNKKSELLKRFRAILIITHTFVFIMLASVDLNDKASGCAVKVNNIRLNDALLIDFNRVWAKEQIP